MGEVGNYRNLFHTASQRAAALFPAGRHLGYRLVREAERCRQLPEFRGKLYLFRRDAPPNKYRGL
jgi:hypothetical protein